MQDNQLPKATTAPAPDATPKSFFASKTLWGVALMLAAPLLARYGITDADANSLITLGAQFFGAAFAVWGRISATRKLTLKGGAK